MKKQIKALPRIFLAVLLLGGLMFQFMIPSPASAAQITVRSLTLQAGAGGDGGSKPGGVVNHLFDMTLASTTSVGSVKVLYCSTAGDVNDPCTTPTGLVTTSATLGANGGDVTGFTINNSTNGAPYLTRTAATVPSAAQLSFRLDNVTNPTTTNTTFFVRIATYASTDATGLTTDTGTVAASTANPIKLSGTMPESLVFCTGATIGKTGGVPDCTTATDGAVNFDMLFTPTDTAATTSQMAASTNAGSGYAITVNGPTLTSGSNTITANNTADVSIHGKSQFGMNLVANTTASAEDPVTHDPFGANIDSTSNGTNYRGEPTTNYSTADSFKYTDGDPVADSSFGGSAGGTDSQIYTATYIVNVPGSQPAGTYTTTLTYICTPTF